MKLLELNDLKLIGLIGSGESGKVYLAEDKEGKRFAVKVFEGIAIHRGLLSKAVSRLEQGQWPKGVLRLEKVDLEGRPAYWVMPFYGDGWDESKEKVGSIWNLQHRLGSYSEDQTWNLIKDIANSLAGMHRKRVAHGNLKPGNIFFDASGHVQMVDWVLGNIPGVSRFGFTDALLYQAPEQLLDSGGYEEEVGYGWDVFSFGVLSYRLLTGKFPRCDDRFSGVAPNIGEDCISGVQADLPMIANSLMESPVITWPDEASNEYAKRYRVWIEQCLRLDAAERPGSMIEVAKGISEVDAILVGEEARQWLIDQRLRAVRAKRHALLVTSATIVVALVLAVFWLYTSSLLKSEKVDRSAEKKQILSDLSHAKEKKTQAEDQIKLAVDAKQEAEDEVKRVADVGMVRLKVMIEIGDRLFEWGMEKGHRTLPVLDGREVRLAQLEEFYETFLKTHAGNEELADELARVRLHLAEISLAASDAVKAEERLSIAIDAWQGRELDTAMSLRLGRDSLLLALLIQRSGKEGLEVYFQRARKALQEVPELGVDLDQLKQWQAILDIHEVKWFVEKGDEKNALEQLTSATQVLNKLADARPDAAVLRSELGSCYLSSATILEGLGKLVDAQEARLLAVEQINKMLKNDPDNVDLMLDLAGCYGAMAEASLLSGDAGITSKLSSDAMSLLDRVLKKQPESRVANTRKGAQLGIQAGLLRDQGKSIEAMSAFNEGITILERQPEHPMRDYRLALLHWQKGRMLGFSGKKEDELKYLSEADAALKKLQLMPDDESPRLENLQRSRAYLLGDLALALEMMQQKNVAEKVYREAIGVWEVLLKLRPNSEEYRSALEWSRQRITRL
jgi:serine/threonine protein kinase